MVKAIAASAAAALWAAVLSGCVIAPAPMYDMQAGPPPGVIVPQGVIYVAPGYPVPNPGHAWAYHNRYGWGWHHPERGWHQGWR